MHGVKLLVSGPTAGNDESALQTAVVNERSFAVDPLENAAELPSAVPLAPASLVQAAMKLDLAVRPKIMDLHPAVYEVPAAGALSEAAAGALNDVAARGRRARRRACMTIRQGSTSFRHGCWVRASLSRNGRCPW